MSSSEENVEIEGAEPTVDTEPAVDATFKHKLNKQELFGKSELNIENEKKKENQKKIEKMLFPNDDSIVSKLVNVDKLLGPSKFGSDKFNNVFEAEKEPLEIGENKVFLYKKKGGLSSPFVTKKGTAIRIICAAYFKYDGPDSYRIIIASRLDTEHEKDPGIKGESLTKDGSPDDKDISVKMINLIKNLVIDKKTDLITSKIILPEDKLTTEFKEKMTEILKPGFPYYKEKEFVENSTVYEEYLISNNLDDGIENKILKFNVEFSIIFVENKKTIYYSITATWDSKENKNVYSYKEYYKEPEVVPAVAAAPPVLQRVA